MALESRWSIIFHVAINGKAACGALVGRFEKQIGEVPEYCRCQRPACRKLWPSNPTAKSAPDALATYELNLPYRRSS